jgi:hypothetical protein
MTDQRHSLCRSANHYCDVLDAIGVSLNIDKKTKASIEAIRREMANIVDMRD